MQINRWLAKHIKKLLTMEVVENTPGLDCFMEYSY